jgi:hypothetical protein
MDADDSDQSNVPLEPEDDSGAAPLSPFPGSTFNFPTNSTSTSRPNPEADSFLYMEGLLESLACLGKLKVAIDTASQRVALEVHNLIEATIEEVDERYASCPVFRSLLALTEACRTSNMLSQRFSLPGRPTSSLVLRAGRPTSAPSFLSFNNPRSSLLRLNASETSALELNAEILKDLFWTLYSKLDAVLQGFRVVYEVALRIGEVRIHLLVRTSRPSDTDYDAAARSTRFCDDKGRGFYPLPHRGLGTDTE